ncbi:L-seryl-tRNA(Sec) selenium transferase [Corynebacterium sp. J010B-136]|uniref:L-seryl-tRNA(Sec) selenium transferase n=1 Tax=Corynebacterium sp. J010B-136 TaxID=2099401 RepID=UPI0018EB3FB7|nr:L-seryl-tRNA(Sec) selenium transferase [Corynebacterium sp. J010B-136]
MTDPRRFIPRVDEILASQAVNNARAHLAEHVIRARIDEVLAAARAGEIAPQAVKDEVEASLIDATPYSLHPVLNATGVIIHTNIGRAPLPPEAVDALVAAAGYTDVELDLDTGLRSKNRGRAAIEALLAACPGAEDALVVNNGAAALLLATAALAPEKEVIISRGELIEIGAGFRLPELIESTSVRLKEIGATNRTHLADYENAVTEKTGAILKVHPSNFRIEGFTSSVGIEPLRKLADERGISLIVDLGSGLLRPDATVPEEPDLQAQLAAGADIVIASGDKLLGGPQAGIMLGTHEAIAKVKRHPLARAVRIDKLRLNALEASINAPSNAVEGALHLDPAEHLARIEALAKAVGGVVVEHPGRVGGGGAPEYPLPGYAVALDESLAPLLRQGRPAVLPRVHNGQCLIDVRCIPASDDEKLAAAILRAQEQAK